LDEADSLVTPWGHYSLGSDYFLGSDRFRIFSAQAEGEFQCHEISPRVRLGLTPLGCHLVVVVVVLGCGCGSSDIIVMGTHGRTGLSRLLMGSVAEAVSRKAHCLVLTVKHPFPETSSGEPAAPPES